MIGKVFRTTVLLAAFCLGGNAAVADPMAGVYDVSNSATNCGSAPHGLWTNDLLSGGGCANYFSVTDMTMVLTDDGMGGLSGSLSGTATNPFDAIATIDLTLSDWCDDLDTAPCAGKGYKQEGGGAYDPTVQDFFATLSGTISIAQGIITNSYDMSIFAHTGQLGIGANAKNLEFGFSTWMTATIAGEPASSHWDINVNLTKAPTSVPEPSVLSLLGLGLLGVGAARRRRMRA